MNRFISYMKKDAVLTAAWLSAICSALETSSAISSFFITARPDNSASGMSHLPS